jgi:hypothetical protein
MKFNETQDNDIMFEMSNFNYRTTGLPTNIEVWARADPVYHGHDRYRIKITKNKEWAAIFSIGQNPEIKKNINQSLTSSEQTQILQWIKDYFPLLISHIDGKIDSAELAFEIQKLRGEK